jgi:hypothetical protein
VIDRPTRRGFLIALSGATVGLVAPTLPGCERRTGSSANEESTVPSFPLLEISGSPYEVGLAIGRRFGDRIRTGLERRRDWFLALKEFAAEHPQTRIDPFLEAATEQFPDIVEELRGWADGSGVPFEDLLVLNLKAELATMKKAGTPETPGCSTLAFAHEGRTLLAHNEDGHAAYRDLMFLVKVRQPGKPAFLCLTYPGILCGNGPAINEAGIVVTTNYIAGLDVRIGVPRYVLSRAAIQAGSLEEAVAIVTRPGRAFAFHYNLASLAANRILSVETSVDRHQVHEVRGLYVHTNHLVLPDMAAVAQDADYVGSSSMSRYRVLERGAAGLRSRMDDVDEAGLLTLLSSHESAPYSPCRHPAGEVRGATLGSALFDITGRRQRLLISNPCQGRSGPFDLESPA